MCLYLSGLGALGTKKINEWVYATRSLLKYLAHIRKTQIVPKFFLMVPMQVNVFGMINFGNLAISSSLVIKQESMEPIMCNGAFVVIWSESPPTHSLKHTMYMYCSLTIMHLSGSVYTLIVEYAQRRFLSRLFGKQLSRLKKRNSANKATSSSSCLEYVMKNVGICISQHSKSISSYEHHIRIT